MENTLTLRFFLPTALTAVRYTLFAGVPFLIFYVFFKDRFKNNQIAKRLASKKDILREISHSVPSLLVIGFVTGICSQTALVEYTMLYRNAGDYPTWWIPVSIVIAHLIHDSYFYWLHRTLHHPKLYKAFHRTHHKSVFASPWAAHSFDIVEAFLESLIAPILLFVLPMHPIALVVYGTSLAWINIYGHLGFEVMPRWFRRSVFFKVMATSVHHSMHHTKFHGNYGLYFRHWDRLMGTEHPDYVAEYDRIQAKRFGEEPAIAEPAPKPQLDPAVLSAIRNLDVSATDSVVLSV